MTRCIFAESPTISRSEWSRSMRCLSERFSSSSVSRIRSSLWNRRVLSMAAAPMAASEERKRRSSSTKLPLFAPRSSFPPTPMTPTMTSPATIGATRRSLSWPPRKRATLSESGSRETMTCLTGGSAINTSAAGASIPNAKTL